MKYDIFLISPVRNATEEQMNALTSYMIKMKLAGKKVYYPALDTDQNDNIGFRICTDNANAIALSEEVHIFYDPQSQGSLFDLGVAFGLAKPLKIINIDSLEKTEGKSFANMIMEWQRKW